MTRKTSNIVATESVETLETPAERVDPAWPDEYVVKDERAARTLLDLKAIRCLGPFLHGTRTLTEAAIELDMSTSSLAYWIAKLEKVGIVERLAPTRRGGMAMPRYRAAARMLFLPFASVPAGLSSELLDGGRRKLLDRFLDGLDEALRKDGHTGLQFTASGPLGVEIDARQPAMRDMPPSWTDFWGTLTLSRDDALAFTDELKRVIDHYRVREVQRGAEFVVHMGIAPVAKVKYRSA